MATRINMLKVPFDYYWPKASAVTCISQLGPVLVKDEVAEAAIGRGYAEPFDPAEKITRTPAKRARKRRGSTNTRSTGNVDRADMAAPDSADRIAPVDDSGQ